MDDLTGKVALVTGGARGIGREIAIGLAGAGCDVAVGYRSNEAAALEVVAAVEALGRKAVALCYDVSDETQAVELVRSAEQALGSVGILINNAGILSRRKPLEELTNGDWHETIQTNLTSAFYVTQAALTGMRSKRWGRIMMLSSIAAQTGGVIGPHYAASKAGMMGLAHSYANLLASEGITVNVIAPALVATDMIKGNTAIKPDLLPVGRFGEADEVASVAVMLAANGYITGQTVNVNGGWYMS
jgi:3-oxoacyl-[acyl-carrier protein] reductase